MRKGWMIKVLALALLLAVASPMPSGQAANSFSARAWYATYEHSRGAKNLTTGSTSHADDMDASDLFYMLQWDGISEKWIFSAMLGFGMGWDTLAQWEKEEPLDQKDVIRFDALLGLARRIGYFTLGGGVHGVVVATERSREGSDDTWTYSYAYFGPEILAGVGVPVGEKFLLRASASYLPYVYWSRSYTDTIEGTDDYTDSGDTTGYSVDGGAVFLLGNWRLGAGYRTFQINRFHWEDRSDANVEQSAEDSFKGPYVMIGWAWQ